VRGTNEQRDCGRTSRVIGALIGSIPVTSLPHSQLGTHPSPRSPVDPCPLTAVVSLRFSPAWVARRQLRPGPRCARAAVRSRRPRCCPPVAGAGSRSRCSGFARPRRSGNRCATTKQPTEALPGAVRTAAAPRLRLRHMDAGGRCPYRPWRRLRAVEAAAPESRHLLVYRR